MQLENQTVKIHKSRILLITLLLILFCFAIIIKLVKVQIIDHEFYSEKAIEQRQQIITLSSPRGDIFDRNGNLLATTIDSFSVFLIPKVIIEKEKTAKSLSEILNLNYEDVYKKCQGHRSFVWVGRKIKDQQASQIIKLDLHGVEMLVEKKRVYPHGHLASQVLGFVGIDNQGLAGVELSLDKYLRGKEGKILTERDPKGRTIMAGVKRVLQEQTYGNNLVLTIDQTIQYLAEKYLKKAVDKNKAKLGMVLIMDTETGELLALAGYPDFDPNYYYKFPSTTWKSLSVSYVYEPGSTFKVITAAAALDLDYFKKDSMLRYRDEITVGGKVIKNAHPIEEFRGRSSITVTEMIQESVNTACVLLGLKIGKNKFYEYIQAFGFGDRINIDLPGESAGIIHKPENWYSSDIGRITFGQSIAVTPIQLLNSVGAIANNGKRLKPYLVQQIESLDGKFIKINSKEYINQPISEKTAKDINEIMVNVTENGTGKHSKITGFKVASKTGTAQKIAPKGGVYWEGHYIASQIAFMPATKPKIAILVIIDDPKGSIWGGTIAAPLIREIGEQVLRYLNIQPDNLT